MSTTEAQFALLVGRAALKLWPSLPRDVQELLFETSAPVDDQIRHDLAVYLHAHHPKTAHPQRPSMLA